MYACKHLTNSIQYNFDFTIINILSINAVTLKVPCIYLAVEDLKIVLIKYNEFCYAQFLHVQYQSYNYIRILIFCIASDKGGGGEY